MDVTQYMDLIEERFDVLPALDQLRDQANNDEDLSDEDREKVLERIFTYAADRQKAEEPFDEDTVPDAVGEDGWT